MIPDIYDYVLILGIVVCLVLFYLEVRILVRQKMAFPSLTSIKFLAIFGILFFVTALVAGSAITGYVTKNVIEDNINDISNGLGESSLAVADLETTVTEIKKTVAQSKPSSDRDELLTQVDYLEHKLKNQVEINRELEDDIDDVEDELEDLYALLPSGNY